MFLKLDPIFSAIQGAKISRGHWYQEVIKEYLQPEYDEIHSEKPIPTIHDNPEIQKSLFKKGFHKVDLVAVDHKKKIVDLINSRSTGIDHSKPPSLNAELYIAAIKGAEKMYPNYTVKYMIYRTSDEKIKELTDKGIRQFNTSKILGKDIQKIVSKRYKEKIKENLERQIKNYKVDIKTAIKLRKTINYLVGDLMWKKDILKNFRE